MRPRCPDSTESIAAVRWVALDAIPGALLEAPVPGRPDGGMDMFTLAALGLAHASGHLPSIAAAAGTDTDDCRPLRVHAADVEAARLLESLPAAEPLGSGKWRLAAASPLMARWLLAQPGVVRAAG
jgi:hypothetical protein